MSVVEGGLPSSFLIITFIVLPAGDVKRSDTANTSNSLGECRRLPGKRSFPGPIARWLPGTEFLYSASDSLRMQRACTRRRDGAGAVGAKGGYAVGKVFDLKGLLDWLNVSIR